MFKWNKGRQDAAYFIFPLLFSRFLGADAYIIHIPEGTEIPQHKDTVANKRHFRLNIHFGNYKGGKFISEKFIFNLFNKAFLFRPDINLHSLQKVLKGNLYIFSIGKTFKKL